MTYIKKGYGFNVGADFARATKDTAIELSLNEYAKKGYVIGYILGDTSSPLGFLRSNRVRVHVQLAAIEDETRAE